MLSVIESRSHSDGVVIRYVLPVLDVDNVDFYTAGSTVRFEHS